MKDSVAHCEGLLEVIKSDMKQLRGSNIGKKCDWYANRMFRKSEGVNNTGCVYVYHHNQHTSCSSVLLSQIESYSCHIDTTECFMPKCTQHPYHDDLQPYFLDNKYLREYYKGAADKGQMDIEPQRNLLEKVLNEEVSMKGTIFESPCSSSNNWREDDWTKRLARGIESSFPNLKVTFSANLGRDFGEIVKILRVANLDPKCFLFRGAPDILILLCLPVQMSSMTLM